jgi:hypothetical protein
MVTCLSVICSNVTMIQTQLSVELNFHRVIIVNGKFQPPLPYELIQLYTELWQQLFFPHEKEA